MSGATEPPRPPEPRAAGPAEPPALAHIERTLAESYRKEIDQEENVWRSLPFFAAALALQLAALFPIADRLPPVGGWTGWLAAALLLGAASATLVALGTLAACIYPRRFQYLATDTELLDYARGLIADEAARAAVREADWEPGDGGPPDGPGALITLKLALALQYAVGAQHNRGINKQRERLRSVAGLATVLSLMLTLLLVATTFLHYVIRQ